MASSDPLPSWLPEGLRCRSACDSNQPEAISIEFLSLASCQQTQDKAIGKKKNAGKAKQKEKPKAKAKEKVKPVKKGKLEGKTKKMEKMKQVLAVVDSPAMGTRSKTVAFFPNSPSMATRSKRRLSL